LAARRIAWGKWFTNAGQVCIAPDHLVVHDSIADQLIVALRKMGEEFFPQGPAHDPAYCRIISRGHTERLAKIFNTDKKFEGFRVGDISIDDKFVPPIVLDFKSDWEVFAKSASMANEIFGPILPIIRYKSSDECSRYLAGLKQVHGSPLALYVFSSESANSVSQHILSICSSGAVVVNDCGIHIAEGCLPFGGIGKSGMGKYHSGKSFEVFTHFRAVLWKTGWLDVPFRYPPMSGIGNQLMQLLLWAARKNITPLRVAKTLLVIGLLYKIFRR